MIRFLADENFHRAIVLGVLRRNPAVDIVIAQDVGLAGADDPTVLRWAADEARVVLSHDVTTLIRHAFARVAAGDPMPGVFEVVRTAPLRQLVEDLLMVAECGVDGEWEGQVQYLPL